MVSIVFPIMQPLPSLSIIIVSYNTRALTVETIRSVVESGAQVIVVDNHSSDDTLEALKQFGRQITVIDNRENVGFARANNQGVKFATGKYILLLNSDTKVYPDALEKMVGKLESDKTIGIVSATLCNPDGSRQPQGGALPSLLTVSAWWLWPFPGKIPLFPTFQDPRPKDWSGWVGGTAMMMRREDYLSLGGLDEKIFMYAEDVDLCWRMHKMHRKVMILPDAVIMHVGSASGSKSRAMAGEVKGIIYLFGKHLPVWQLPMLRLILACGSLLRYLFFGILQRSKAKSQVYWDIFTLCLSKK